MRKKLSSILICLVLALITFCSGTALAAKKKSPHKKKPKKINSVFISCPQLRGSPESLIKQNEIADVYSLPRIKDWSGLDALREFGRKDLSRVPDKEKYFYIDKKLDKRLRFLSPCALDYLESLASSYNDNFGKGSKLKVTSLVRTFEYQKKLSRHNHNAVWSSDPEMQSVHPTGFAFDISTKGMKQKQILWFAQFLAKDEDANVIEATYEPYGGDFHIMVFPLRHPSLLQ